MSAQKRPNLALLAVKFLKFQQLTNNASPYTCKSYATDLNQFLPLRGQILHCKSNKVDLKISLNPQINSKPLSRWTEKSLLEWAYSALNQWRALKPASRNRKSACLKSFLKWLHKEGWTQKDLSQQIPHIKVPPQLPHFLSLDEVLSVISTLKKQKKITELALVYLLYGGGLRISEACQLQWSDLYWKDRLLKVLGKGQQERLVSLPPVCFKGLKNLPQEGPYIWGTKPLSPRKAYEMVRSSGKRAQLLHPLNPHALRHSYATHLLSSGSDLRTLQELLGHRSLTATQKYTHLNLDQLAETMETKHPLGKAGES